MKTVKGNLLTLAANGQFDAIIHGCNIFHTFGNGIAREIRVKYPTAYDRDKETIYGDVEKVGDWNTVKVGDGFFIINLYTQARISDGSFDVFEYEAFKKGLESIKESFSPETKFGIPMIGAGLGGGDWERIKQIIVSVGFNDITVVEYDGT